MRVPPAVLAFGVVIVLAGAGLAAVMTRYERVRAVPQGGGYALGYIDRWTGHVCLVGRVWLRCYCKQPAGYSPPDVPPPVAARTVPSEPSTASSAEEKLADQFDKEFGGPADQFFKDYPAFEQPQDIRDARLRAERKAAAAACN